MSTADPLHPYAPLDEFEFGPWHVTIAQRVTGALFWVAERNDPRTVRHMDYPAGFTVRDVAFEARRALAP